MLESYYDNREEDVKFSWRLRFGIMRIFSLQNNFKDEILNEIEYKALLSKSKYERLSCYLRLQYPCEVIDQTDIYYNTPKFELL